MFIDRVVFHVAAGKGGNGVVAWRREKYIPKGGPCGGNGGPGGSVYVRASIHVPSLEEYRHRRVIKADNGQAGGRSCSTGRKGADLIIQVPCGTLVKDANTKEVLFDLTEDGQQVLLCRGGTPGKGNNSFKTPTHQAPNVCTPGKPGQEMSIELELKLIADVGMVGFPNAGKSTFMLRATNVPVKIAAYPFTTLRPQLGYIPGGNRVLLADIPGIIEGAHQNRGLGLEFLRHIERTHLLLFLVDASGIDGRTPWEDFATLRHELHSYNSTLLDKPYLVLLNKIDTEEGKENLIEFQKRYPDLKEKLFVVSALTGTGIAPVIARIHELMHAMKSPPHSPDERQDDNAE